MLPLDSYLSVTQIAEQFGISPPTVRRWIREGGLPAFKRGRVVLIHVEQLERWMLRQTENAEVQAIRRVS